MHAILLAGALCYSELGTLMGKTGGEYQYLREAFGNAVAFLYAWTSVIVIRPSSLAIISLTFAEYASTVFSLCGTPQLPVKLTAATILCEQQPVGYVTDTLSGLIQMLPKNI